MLEEKSEKMVIIMRGIPGSGKTTFWRKYYPDAVCCSANDFFTDADGVYWYVPSDVRYAHEYCQGVFKSAIRDREPLIVVDNTNIKKWEVDGYVKYAAKCGYTVKVFRMIADDWREAAERNIHSVPNETVERMYYSMEEYPGELKTCI